MDILAFLGDPEAKLQVAISHQQHMLGLMAQEEIFSSAVDLAGKILEIWPSHVRLRCHALDHMAGFLGASTPYEARRFTERVLQVAPISDCQRGAELRAARYAECTAKEAGHQAIGLAYELLEMLGRNHVTSVEPPRRKADVPPVAEWRTWITEELARNVSVLEQREGIGPALT